MHDFAVDFPILQRLARGQRLAYLDSAATTQKPQSVIDAISQYYSAYNANVHRGIYELSEVATAKYEGARERVRAFINAAHQDEVVFTRGTTDSINLIAQTFAAQHLSPGDEVVISTQEHHSNIVPWQLVCERYGATLKVIAIDDQGVIDLDDYARLLTERVKLVSVVHVSNTLGIVNPIEKMISLAHAQQIPILIDGAQALPHLPVDVQALGCDFYVSSAHKMYGPTGIGLLYAKRPWLETLPPYQGGGDMIRTVTFEKTTYNEPPYKFEAGTPNMAGAIGFAAAVDYIEKIGFDVIQAQERQCYQYAQAALSAVPGFRQVGLADEQISVISFEIANIHPHDLSTLLDQSGVAIRAGHHCTMPLMQRLKLPATARMSLGIYNTQQDIDQLVEGLQAAVKLFNSVG